MKNKTEGDDFNLFMTLTDDQRVSVTYDRLSHPQHRGDIEDLAAAHVALMTQAVRMRTALEFISDRKSLSKVSEMRKFARTAIEYAEEFTITDVIASYKRVAKPGMN